MKDTNYYYTDSGTTEWIVTQGQPHSYPWHVHTRHMVVGMVCSGSVQLTTALGSQCLSAGAHFDIAPFEAHSLNIAADSLLLVVCFEKNAGVSLSSDLEKLLLHASLPYAQQALCAQTLEQFSKPLPGLQSCQPAKQEPGSLLSQAVWAVIIRMLEEPDSFPSLEAMASHAGYSQWHFLRAFHTITGMTPHAFQLVCRLRLVRGLLRADTASALAAASAGFSDQSHMHTVFKKHHGMTPKQFKQASFKLL